MISLTMNYGARLLGATIALIYFLRLCGVLGEVVDHKLITKEIYEDYFEQHQVDDIVKEWILHDSGYQTRALLARAWDQASCPECNTSRFLETFFQSPPGDYYTESGDELYPIDYGSKPNSTTNGSSLDNLCYLQHESRENLIIKNKTEPGTTTVVPDIGSGNGCRYTDINEMILICDTNNLRNLPTPMPERLELLQLNFAELSYIGKWTLGSTQVTAVKIQATKLSCIHPEGFQGIAGLKMLYLENNLIEYFRPDYFPSLDEVTVIFMEHNRINLTSGGSSVGSNCSATLALPSLMKFSLLGNPLQEIPADYFCALRSSPLNYLDLTNCQLTTIHKGAFTHLSSLKTLKLGENPSLMVNLTSIFGEVGSTTSLKEMWLESNSLSTVPTQALAHISSTLETLDLSGNLFDTLTVDSFPLGMSKLKQLSLENCRIRHVDPKAFKNMPNLHSLFLAKNRLAYIPQSITYLPRLYELDLSGQVPQKSSTVSTGTTTYTFQLSPQVFVNSSELRFLKLENLVEFHNVVIARSTFQALTSLTALMLADSNIAEIPDYAFENLKSLKHLDLSFNKISKIRDLTFYGLKSLTGLYLDSNKLDFPCQVSYFSESEKIVLKKVEPFPGSKWEEMVPRDEETGVPLPTNVSELEPFRYMPNLRTLRISNNGIRFVHSILFQHLPNLQDADMCGNLFKSWQERLFIQGSIVKYLALARNNIGPVSQAMLEDLKDVVSRPGGSVDISQNPLVCDENGCLLKDYAEDGTIPLANWDSGKYMCWDIKTNDYYSLARSGSRDICEIIRDREEGGPSTEGSSSDGSTSRSSSSSTSTTTTVSVSSPYPPSSTPGNQPGSGGASTPRAGPITEASTSTIMATVAIVFLCLFFTTSLAVVGYKKRFHLKYFWFVVKFNVIHSPNLNLTGMKRKDSLIPDYDYDLFVSYNHSDRDFIENYLVPNVEGQVVNEADDVEAGNNYSAPIKICIHERDFKAGVPITENIVDCVDRSKKAVVVVSKNYLESQWCLYEMNLTYHRLIESRRKAFVVILLENIPSTLRTKSLNYLLLSRTYLDWPGTGASASEKQTFWKRLRNSLSELD